MAVGAVPSRGRRRRSGRGGLLLALLLAERAQYLLRGDGQVLDPHAGGVGDGVRDRAEEFAALAEAGRAGVNISGELRVDDVVQSLGLDAAQENAPADETGGAAAEGGLEEEATPSDAMPYDETSGDASAEDGHDGHDHEE